MKSLFSGIRVIGGVLFLTLSCFAELQEWTLADGTSFQGEFVTVYSTDAAFKDPSGKVIKIPLDRFSSESRMGMELAKPPKLEFDLINAQDKTIFPMGINTKTQRPPETRSHYGVRIKQASAGKYNHELFVELFVIGRERQGNQYMLLDHQKGGFFLNEENRREFELRSEREVILRNFTVGLSVRGETYYGYLAVVRDLRGEIIAAGSSHDWLLDNLENLMQRKVGNFMDKSCQRVFPTRPPRYQGEN